MADFVKKTWSCGDTITADDLNRLEGGVEDALECCGSGDAGYSCTETTTLLTNESVTTVADADVNGGTIAYSTPIDADTIKVTFNGVEYICDAQDEGLMGKAYGAPMGEDGIDWSEYPFQILSGLRNSLYTELAGTYSVKIETEEESVETSECFKKAVISASSLVVGVRQESDATMMSETWQTIHDAIAKGVHVVLVIDKNVYAITSAIVYGEDISPSYAVLVTDTTENAPTVKKYLATSADGYPALTR